MDQRSKVKNVSCVVNCDARLFAFCGQTTLAMTDLLLFTIFTCVLCHIITMYKTGHEAVLEVFHKSPEMS